MVTSSQKSHVSRARHASHAVGSQSGRVAVLCGVLFLSGTGRPYFRNTVAAIEWLGVWQLDLGCGADSFEFHGGSGIRKRAGCIIENSAMAAACISTLCWSSSSHSLAAQLFLVFRSLGDLMRPVWQLLWNYQPMLLGLRFVVSFLILLLPTTAMGLTLPVIIEDPLLRQTEFGRAIGFLYGSNTLGAMVRCRSR